MSRKVGQVSDMTRRSFLKGAAGAASLSAAGPTESGIAGNSSRTVRTPGPRHDAPVQNRQGLRVEGDRILAQTRTLSAEIHKGFITSLTSKITGDEFIRAFDITESSALALLYRGEELVGIDESRFGSTRCRQISEHRAEVILQSWDGDGILSISLDEESGDLIIEPSAYSSRPGVRACRWNLKGLRNDLQLVAPFFQGIKLRLDDPSFATAVALARFLGSRAGNTPGRNGGTVDSHPG